MNISINKCNNITFSMIITCPKSFTFTFIYFMVNYDSTCFFGFFRSIITGSIVDYNNFVNIFSISIYFYNPSNSIFFIM